MSNNKETKSKILILAAGGAGGKVVSDEKILGSTGFLGFGEVEIVYFDSSESDLLPTFKGKKVINPLWDGFGKDQTLAHKNLKGMIPQYLKDNPPGALNVVVMGLSGATGSVLGTLLIEALLSLNVNVLVIGIAAANCKKSTGNTLNTINSLRAISNKAKKPIVMSYHDNYAEDSSFSKVNQNVAKELRTMLVLGGGANTGIDSSDIGNMINFNRVTTHTPDLSDLLINYGPNCEVGIAITSLSLLVNPESPPLAIRSIYAKDGFMDHTTVTATKDPLPDTHFIVTKELAKSRRVALEKALQQYELEDQIITDTADEPYEGEVSF